MRAPDPAARLVADVARATGRRSISTAERDGIRTNALLVATIRFQRLIRWSLRAKSWFLADTPAFVDAFRRYHRAVPMTAHFPRQEARLFRAWLAAAAQCPAARERGVAASTIGSRQRDVRWACHHTRATSPPSVISALPIVTRSKPGVFTIWLAIGPPSKLSATRMPER